MWFNSLQTNWSEGCAANCASENFNHPFLAVNSLLLFAAYFSALYRMEKFLLTRQLFWSTSEIFQGQKWEILLGKLQVSTVTISKVSNKKIQIPPHPRRSFCQRQKCIVPPIHKLNFYYRQWFTVFYCKFVFNLLIRLSKKKDLATCFLYN